jgi:hypothetical protein
VYDSKHERKSQTALAAVLAGIALCVPAAAQRTCPANPAAANINAIIRASGAAANRAADKWSGGAPPAVVTGRGQAELTDPDGEKFTHQFAITAVVDRDGTARGKATFVFSQRFSQKWGAVPGVDLIHLEGDLKTGSVDSAGQVSLVGPFVETDYSRSEGIVYQEDSSVSGAAPLAIVISPDSRKFTLAWCAFIPGNGYFSAEVKEGHLKVHQASDRLKAQPDADPRRRILASWLVRQPPASGALAGTSMRPAHLVESRLAGGALESTPPGPSTCSALRARHSRVVAIPGFSGRWSGYEHHADQHALQHEDPPDLLPPRAQRQHRDVAALLHHLSVKRAGFQGIVQRDCDRMNRGPPMPRGCAE